MTTVSATEARTQLDVLIDAVGQSHDLLSSMANRHRIVAHTRLTAVISLPWLLLASALPATANPVRDGQQLCVMLRSGISQEKAWGYIMAEHRKAALAPLQHSVPWFSSAAAGWAVGTTLGRLEQSEKELAAMKPDILRVARTTCPEQFR